MPSMPYRHAYQLTTLLSILSLVLFLLLSSNATAQARLLQQPTQQHSLSGSAAQAEKDIRLLEPGKAIERELAGGESHTYRITLQTGQFLQVEVEQRGINVVVTLTGPSGEKLAVVDLQFGTLGIEPVWWEAQKAGTYRLEVRAVSAKASGGKYVLRSEVKGTATGQDRDRQAAERLLIEAGGLVQEGSAESQRRAIEKREQALRLWRKVSDRYWEAYTLNNIGNVYNALGEMQKALEFYTQSLSLRRAVGDRPGAAETLYSLARFERDRNNLTEARRYIESALSIIESLRAGYTNQQLRSAFFATFQDYYEFYIDLLMRLHKLHPQDGFDSLALQTSERARARALLETLAEVGADIRQGVDPHLVERERSLQQRLNAKGKNKIDLLSRPRTVEQASALDKEIEALTAEFQQVEAEIRQKSPRYAALTQPQPLTVQQIRQQVLDSDTLLLEYSLGTDHSYLWAATPTSITSYELPKREEIERVARQVYALFSRTQLPAETIASSDKRGLGLAPSQEKRGLTLDQSTNSSERAVQRLSRMVLSPVAAQLGRKRLLIIADGALQFIPFSALPNPLPINSREAAPPLIVEHEVISLPSASTLAVLRRDVQGRAPAQKAIAVLADPVFASADERLTKTAAKTVQLKGQPEASADESRGLGLTGEQLSEAAVETNVTRAGLVIPRLPFTRREAEQIAALVPAQQRMEALDFAASRPTMLSPQLSQYRYVHIATHGFLDSQHPELSGIVLSMVDEQGKPQDGFLRAHEVFNLKLPAELVVLSACQTGLGKEVKGEGLIGLTRGFMYAGSPRVVVSLWSVNDEATAELMTRFYRGMLKEGLRPAKALQAAQVSMLKEKRYSAPFYWAAFTLQGEWR